MFVCVCVHVPVGVPVEDAGCSLYLSLLYSLEAESPIDLGASQMSNQPYQFLCLWPSSLGLQVHVRPCLALYVGFGI